MKYIKRLLLILFVQNQPIHCSCKCSQHKENHFAHTKIKVCTFSLVTDRFSVVYPYPPNKEYNVYEGIVCGLEQS